jgi:lipopolysaccharide export system permease protein
VSTRTLSAYLGARFARWMLGVFAFGLVLIFVVDFFELVRRAADRDTFTVGAAAAISALRTPSLAERVLPFAVLFGSIFAFAGLARSSELVAVRAAGVSVWQFILPPVALAIAIGTAATLGYNPAAAWLLERADEFSTSLLGQEQMILSQSSGDLWLSQGGANGSSILHARRAVGQGRTLFGVNVFEFDKDGGFERRVDSWRARYEEGDWVLDDATIYTADAEPEHNVIVKVATELRPDEIAGSAARPDTVPFWSLPTAIDRADRMGSSVAPYRLQFQALLALPLLLGAIVVVAATVSLRAARLGGGGRLITAGIVAGFVLYVVTEIARDLGSSGIVSPFAAAWSPAIVALFAAASILLVQEDG